MDARPLRASRRPGCARSTSCSRVRASESTIGRVTVCGDPAHGLEVASRRRPRSRPRSRRRPGARAGARSRASPPRSSSRPGDCSPSRRVVSKICTRSIVVLLVAPPAGATNRPHSWPQKQKSHGRWDPPVASSSGVSGLLPYTPASAAGGLLSSRPRASPDGVQARTSHSCRLSGGIRACQAATACRGVARPGAGSTVARSPVRTARSACRERAAATGARRAGGRKQRHDRAPRARSP